MYLDIVTLLVYKVDCVVLFCRPKIQYIVVFLERSILASTTAMYRTTETLGSTRLEVHNNRPATLDSIQNATSEWIIRPATQGIW